MNKMYTKTVRNVKLNLLDTFVIFVISMMMILKEKVTIIAINVIFVELEGEKTHITVIIVTLVFQMLIKITDVVKERFTKIVSFAWKICIHQETVLSFFVVDIQYI